MKLSVRDMTLIALFAVLTFIGGLIKVPVFAVPFTLQTLVSLLAGLLLGARLGLLSQILYILMGLIGLPVFAYGGGIAYVLNPTFGFLIGMVVASGLIGWLSDRFDPDRSRMKVWQALIFSLSGTAVVYLVGVPYLYMIQTVYAGSGMTFVRAIEVAMLPFLIGDTLKSVFAAVLAPRVRRLTRRHFEKAVPKVKAG